MYSYTTRWVPAGVLLVLLTIALSASAAQRPNVNLTGSWRDDRGRVSLVRQVDSDVCWSAESRTDGQEVFCGVIDRNMITGQWMTLPGSRQLTSGQLTLRVDSSNRIVKVRSTSRYDAATWSRDNSRAPGEATNNGFPSNNVTETSQKSWEPLAGAGRDIGVGSDGSVWLIGAERTAGGYQIFNRIRNQWTQIDGGAVRIDVDGAGTPWIVNSEGMIFRRERNQWQPMPGYATDIGAGAQGEVWIIGTNPVPGGFGIYRWNGRDWISVEGGAVRIDVDGAGKPWIANVDGTVYRRERNQWQKLPGSVRDISVNAAGDVWAIGSEAVTGGFSIHHWAGTGWVTVEGGAMQISVGNNVVYVVNSDGAIYRRQQ